MGPKYYAWSELWTSENGDARVATTKVFLGEGGGGMPPTQTGPGHINMG